uniref:Uncharacterized protein n=1 Tax=Marinobacter nauticus TaxID=2743 RepID=A0A455W5I3_MARNT|nr:hypothetical protein YBY_24730 [Marinobacter nauticus]
MRLLSPNSGFITCIIKTTLMPMELKSDLSYVGNWWKRGLREILLAKETGGNRIVSLFAS